MPVLAIGIPIIVVIVIMLITSFAPVTKIGSGQAGVEILFGKVTGKHVAEGLHFINPLAEVERFNLRVQLQEQSYSAASKDLQEVISKMAINYAIPASKAPAIYQKVGKEYFERVMVPAAQEALKSEIALHNASEILKNRSAIRQSIHTNLQSKLEKYGIVIHDLALTDIGFSKEYEQAIEAAQLEEQRIKQKAFERQKEEEQKKIVKIQAEAEQVKIETLARAQAEKIAIEAKAQAEANRLIAQSITSGLLQMKYYETWNGQLPSTLMSGGAEGVLFQVPGNK